GSVVVRLCDEEMKNSTVPRSLLEHVVHTKEAVLLDDAAVDNPFSADPYLARRRARSVFCLPLMNQAEFLGLLYLENTLARRIFAPASMAVLKLLASQAAISIENSRLYRDLAERGAELARVSRLSALNALTASISHEVNQPLTGIINNASTCL